MSQKSDGMNYAPQGKPNPVVKPGEFAFAAAHLPTQATAWAAATLLDRKSVV